MDREAANSAAEKLRYAAPGSRRHSCLDPGLRARATFTPPDLDGMGLPTLDDVGGMTTSFQLAL